MKKLLIITCTSFTAVILSFTLLAKFDFAPTMTNSTPIQVFILTLSIAALMYLGEIIEDRFEINSLWADALIRLFICYATIFLEGHIFRWFETTPSAILIITPILVPAFIITYWVSYSISVEYTETINQIIKRKK
jgi:hypothetical protein